MEIHVSQVADPMLLREVRIGDPFVMHESHYTGVVLMHVELPFAAARALCNTYGKADIFAAVVIGARGITKGDKGYFAPGTILTFNGNEPVTPLMQVEPLALRATEQPSRREALRQELAKTETTCAATPEEPPLAGFVVEQILATREHGASPIS